MEIETVRCDECGEKHDVCGDCGGRHVTPVDYISGDVDHEWMGVKQSVLDADDGDVFDVVQVCWDCGAKCIRTVTVEVEHNEGT